MPRIFIVVLLMLALSTVWATAYLGEDDETMALPSVNIPEVSDFAAEGHLAETQDRVIMLLVSQVHCPYCVLIKEEIIHPMIRGDDFADQLLIRELIIDKADTIRSFNGKSVSAMKFAKQHGASLTPTLLFLDPKGNELTERMIGINTPEMYFYYVDQAIRKALVAMKP